MNFKELEEKINSLIKERELDKEEHSQDILLLRASVKLMLTDALKDKIDNEPYIFEGSKWNSRGKNPNRIYIQTKTDNTMPDTLYEVQLFKKPAHSNSNISHWVLNKITIKPIDNKKE